MNDIVALINDTVVAASKLRTVYPLYFASRIMRSLKAADTEGLIATVDGFDTLGNSRYAVKATDINGTRYRITVEVVS